MEVMKNYKTTEDLDFSASDIGTITGKAVYVGTTGVTQGKEPQNKITVQPIDLWVIKDGMETLIGKSFDMQIEKLYLFVKQSYGFALPESGTILNLALKKGAVRQDYKTKEDRDPAYIDNYWLNIDKKFDISVTGQQTLDTPVAVPNTVDAKNINGGYKASETIWTDEKKLHEKLRLVLDPFSPMYNRQASILWQVASKLVKEFGDSKPQHNKTSNILEEFKALCGYEFYAYALEQENLKESNQNTQDELGI